MPADTVQTIGRWLASALHDTLDTGENPTEPLLTALGWETPAGVDDIGLAALNPVRLFELVAKLDLRIDVGSDDSAVSLQLQAELLVELQAFVGRIRNFSGALAASLAASGDYVSRTKIDRQFAQRLIDLALIRFVERRSPTVHAGLVLLGIFRIEFREDDHSIGQIAHLHHAIDFDRIGTALTDIPQLLGQHLGWGTPNFKVVQFVAFLGYLLQQLGLPGTLQKLPRRVEERLSGRSMPQADALPMPRILISFDKAFGWNPMNVGVALYGLRPTVPGGSDSGFGLSPFVRGTAEASVPLTARTSLLIEGGAAMAHGLALLVRPNGFEMKGGILSGGPLKAVTDTVALGMLLQAGAGVSFRVITIPGGSRLEFEELSLRAGGRPEPFVEIALRRARFVLSLEDGGGLLGAILPKDLMTAELDLALGCAGGRFFLRGSAGLQVTFPVHLSLGPVDLQTVTVELAPASGGLPIEVSASLRTALGPLTFAIERLGIMARFAFPADAGGNLGPLDAKLGFKVPTGIGLTLDAGPISGGGYLGLDPAGQRYAGVLQLKLPMCSVVAFGIYEQVQGCASFVAVLGIRFTPGIQLSFGFTLNGVGGLVGLNRRADIDVLRDRLASGAAGNVLFCEDPLRNAPSLLSDLAAFFPPIPSGFLVGPTLQIGWMSPLVRFDLGIMIELPGPSKIVIVGSARLMIGADETLALLYLRMDVLGCIDFDNKLIAFDAQLVNSHALGIFRLSGGMAFRLAYGSGAYILLSVGGFHPRFDPGPLKIPALPRVGASFDISVVVDVYLRLEMYVAFTSNTLQIGALVEAGMRLGPLQAEGHFQFDALIQFQPFAFDADFSAGFNVRAFGLSLASVDIDGRVSGPGPIVVHASGSIRRFGIKVKGSATFEIGDHNADRVDVIANLVQTLAPELMRADNLRAEGDDSTALPKPDRGAVPGVLVLPRGVLIWEQKRVPLKTLVDRFEGSPLNGQHELMLEGPPGWTVADESDWFSPGRFSSLDTKASQTLNNATFQELPSGLRIGLPNDGRAADVRKFAVELHLIKRPQLDRFKVSASAYSIAALAGASRERSVTPAVAAGAPKVSVQPETFDVRDATGAAVTVGQTPFQAFQLSRQKTGRVAVPSSDEMVAL